MQALHVWGKLLQRGHTETCSAAALQELVTCLAPRPQAGAAQPGAHGLLLSSSASRNQVTNEKPACQARLCFVLRG